MQRGAPHVVLDVGIRAGLQQALGGIGTRVSGSQVQGGLPCAVRLVVQAGALVDEVGDDGRCIFFFFAIACLKAPSTAGGDHEGCEAICREERDRGGHGRGGIGLGEGQYPAMAMAALLQPSVQGTVVGTDTPLSTQWLLGAVEVTLSFRRTEP